VSKPKDIASIVQALTNEATEKPQPWQAVLEPGCFPAASLTSWLPIVTAAGVPFIPAEIVAEIPMQSLLRFDHFDDEKIQADLAPLDQLCKNPVPGTVLRWDCCAPMGVKHVMGRPGDGECPAHEKTWFSPDDPRAYDIFFETPLDIMRVLRRPWVPALMHEGYPVEFRVYVEDGLVVGASNYYVQMALPATEEMLGYARQAVALTEKILEEADKQGKRPINPGRRESPPGKPRVTLDFLVRRENHEVVFIEAGPGFGSGAHPCCFAGPEMGVFFLPDVDAFDGIRLAPGGPSLPLR